MRLSVVIVTCNSRLYIRACLDALFAQNMAGLEVIVVDNGSSDDTQGVIQKFYTSARLIQNCTNEGACKARNQGIAMASGDWILTLDSDVIIGKDFIKNFMARCVVFPPFVGMVQTNILNEGAETIYSQGIELTFLRRFHDINRGRKKATPFVKQEKVLGPCSAAAFYRRFMLDQLKEPTGYFDERFFFLVEDVDLAWRAHRAGWHVQFCPELVCDHRGDGSQTAQKIRQYLCIRNRYLMIDKNEKFWKKMCVHVMAFPYEFLRIAYGLCCNKYLRKKYFI